MNTEFFKALDALERQKGIPKEYMIEKVEAALLTAFKRDNGYSNVRIVLDPIKKDVKVYKLLTVVDPDAEVVENVSEVKDTVQDHEEAVPEKKSIFHDDDDDQDRCGILYDSDTDKKKTNDNKKVINEAIEISLEKAREKSKRVKVGDVVEVEIKPKNFGRISAQTAKQVIIQGIREAERGIMIKEYESKKEEIVTALVSKVDTMTGNAVLEIGKNEVTLFKNEQIPGEVLTEGDTIKVYVMEIKKDTRGQAVVLSRTHPGLVKRLFELEVPEILDGTVIIKSVAREAGSRTKISVYSRDPNVDPIGSCIGPKGIRKNNITDEINGEKIDIIKYSENVEEYVKAALSPANVDSVIETGERSCRALVDDEQLSLAIGKEGQNARLAAKLTGFKIDIKSATAARAALMSDIIEGKAETTTTLGGELARALKEAADNGDELM